MNLALNNLQRLIRHKTQQTKPNQTKMASDTLLSLSGQVSLHLSLDIIIYEYNSVKLRSHISFDIFHIHKY